MDPAISKLEAEILNLQSVEQAVMDQVNAAYRMKVSKIAAEIVTRGYKGVIVQPVSMAYEKNRFTHSVLFGVPFEYMNDEVLHAIMDEADKPLDGKFISLASRIGNIKRQIGERMPELAKLTEIKFVRGGNTDHCHLFTVRGDKVYFGQILALEEQARYFDQGVTNAKIIDKFKAEGFCPMYVATNPSPITSPEAMINYAIIKLINSQEWQE